MMSKSKKTSDSSVLPNGIVVLNYNKVIRPQDQVTTGYTPNIQEHIEKTIGPIATAFEEKKSKGIHLKLYLVPPTNQPPSELHPHGTFHHTIITDGLSSIPMNAPKDYQGPKLMELMITLPSLWPGLNSDGSWNEEVLSREENWWPLRWLMSTARIPIAFNTFLGLGHSIPNGNNADPFAGNTRLGCLLLTWPFHSPEATVLTVNAKTKICFLALQPIYPEEMQFRLHNHTDDLDSKLAQNNITELFDINRKAVV